MNRSEKGWKYYFTKSDAGLATLLLALALAFFGLFWYDYTKGADIGNRKIIGKIIYKNNIVERKFADDVVWSRLHSNSPLTNMDLIRSENLSNAVIYLQGNIKIRIEENTMFFLDLTGDTFHLEFRGGSILIEQDRDPKKITIKSGETQIDLGNATLAIEGASEKQGQPPEDLNIVVEKGKADIVLHGQKHEVKAHERARIERNSVKIRELEVILKSPPAQAVRIADSTKKAVSFQFSTRKGFRAEALEIAEDRSFRRSRQSYSPDQARRGIPLKPGSYYWRVRARNPGTQQRVFSETRRIHIKPALPLRTFGPSESEVIRYVETIPKVGFAWSPSPVANSYQLEISKNREFSGKVHRYETEASSYTVEGLADGEYYWRVRAKSDLPGVADSLSPVRRFRIEKKDSLDAPVAERPKNGRSVGHPKTSKEGILFIWKGSPEFTSYEWQLSPKSSFRELLQARKVQGNLYQLEEGAKSTLAPGMYYWRVRGITPSGRKSPFSRPASFFVKKAASTKADQNAVARSDAQENTKTPDLDSEEKQTLTESGKKTRDDRNRQKEGQSKEESNRTRKENPGNKKSRIPNYLHVPDDGSSASVSDDPKRNNINSNKKSEATNTQKLAEADAMRHASLDRYHAFVRGLKRSCPASPLPDLVIRECFEQHVTLNLSNRSRRNIYYFITLKSRNLQDRMAAYRHFAENCAPDFRPAREWMQSRLVQKRASILPQERELLLKAIERQKSCR